MSGKLCERAESSRKEPARGGGWESADREAELGSQGSPELISSSSLGWEWVRSGQGHFFFFLFRATLRHMSFQARGPTGAAATGLQVCFSVSSLGA